MASYNVLIIDDEEIVRRETADYLTCRGHAVRTAVDGASAFAHLAEKEAEIVLLDLRMPGVDGRMLLTRIKAEYPDTEVIMVTGHGDTKSVIEAIRGGAIDFCLKPTNGTDIEAAMERAMQHREKRRRLTAAEAHIKELERGNAQQ